MPVIRKPKMSKKTVIFFDYDDTLLPSTFLATRGLRLDTTDTSALKEVEGALKEVETAVVAVVTKALTFGEVCFVTNAETGWVQLSAQKFMPGLVSLLDKVDVVSARSTYEGMFPDAPLKWKFYAFQRRLYSDTKSDFNVLSFGDSHVEREAVIAVTRGVPNTVCKSIKFAERPTIDQLRQQIELISNCFHYIHLHDGDLDLQLTVTPNTDLSIQAAGGETDTTTCLVESLLEDSSASTFDDDQIVVKIYHLHISVFPRNVSVLST